MTRWRTAGLTVAAFVATLAIAWVVAMALRDEGGEHAEPEADEVSVLEAARAVPERELAVRGFVFIDDATGPVLCSQTTGGARPACEGDVLRLESLDVSRLALDVADDPSGGYDAWSDGEVVLLGTTRGGARLVVKDVLPT